MNPVKLDILKDEVYISTDIETDGPIPGEFSMLSFGSAAFTAQKHLVGTFSINLVTLPGAKQDPETMRWWQDYPEAWQSCRENVIDPAPAMKQYAQWIDTLGRSPVFVGYPASFDFTFIYWYLIKFTGSCPFTYVALDIKSMVMPLLQKPFHMITKSAMPKHWFDRSVKKHIALDDAIEQGWLFCNILAEIFEK